MNSEIIVNGLFLLVGSGIGSIGGVVAKRYFDQRDKRKIHDVAKQVKSDGRLEEYLKEIRELTDASRASIWAFSNGGYFYTGKAMQHLSMIGEVVKKDYFPIKEKCQRLPLHLFTRNLSKLVDSGNGFFQEYNELQYNDALSKFHTENDIVSVACFIISNTEGKMIGVLSLTFSQHRLLESSEIELIKLGLPAIQKEIINK